MHTIVIETSTALFKTLTLSSLHDRYETGNGIQAQESGYVQPAQDPSQSALNVEGGYSYTAPDGTPISVKYVAGPQGFVPVGNHLPTPPPLPPAIAKLLEFLATQPSTPEPAYNKRK